MATEVAQVIKKKQCKKILNDLSKATLAECHFETYEMPKQALKNGIDHAVQRALVVRKMGPNAEFLETVFVNQGNIVKLFDDIDAAKRWLTEDK